MDLANHDSRVAWAGCGWPDPLDQGDEVAVAKARLLELTGRRRDVSALIQQYPLASLAASFALGMFLAGGTNLHLAREGILWALHAGLASAFRT